MSGPTTPSAYEELVAAIVKAVPEIMELKHGCRIRRHSDSAECLVNFITLAGAIQYDHPTVAKPADLFDCEFDNLGRPITLEDVLRTLDAKEKWICVLANGQFAPFSGSTFYPDLVKWNLGHSLEWHRDHTPQTITFLHSLLCA